MAASGADDSVPRRRPVGLVSAWGPMRAATLRKLRSAPRSRPMPAEHPGAAHLAWVCAQLAEVPDKTVLAAALDMLDGTVTDLASPEARHHALALAATASAIAGHRAHLICLAQPNAARLHQLTARIAEGCGVTTALIADDARIDERTSGHAAMITTASAARFAQDMLRDKALLGGRARGSRARISMLASGGQHASLVRGAPMAFVDDADLVMIEAPRPVGFNADPQEDADRMRAEEAFTVLRGLAAGADYQVDQATRRIQMTAQGEAKLELAAALFEGPWLRRAWREETILAALTIRDFFQPGKDYAVQDDQVVLTQALPASSVEPGIEALIAAKENLASRSTLSGLWSYRSFLSSYRHLAGAGHAASQISEEIAAAYGLEVRGRSESLAAVQPVVTDARGRAEALRELGSDAIFWAPTPKDVQQVGSDPKRTLIAEQVFALPQAPTLLVQIAAAHPRWERRLRATYPEATIRAFATPSDGIFDTLGEDTRALGRFRDAPSPGTYRAVQDALAQAGRAQRAAHLKSDRYFERILAFTGDGP